MVKKKQKKKKKVPEQAPRPKDFLDMIAPAAVKFNTDHFILGSRYHTAMALKSYPCQYTGVSPNGQGTGL